MVVGFITIRAYKVLSLNSTDKTQIAIKRTLHVVGKPANTACPAIFQFSYFRKYTLKKLRVIIWIAETCSCWTIVACSWIMNWGVDSRITSNIPKPSLVKHYLPPSICSLQFFIDSPGHTGHSFMKFLRHKINALNRVKASANGSTQKYYLELSRSAHHYIKDMI